LADAGRVIAGDAAKERTFKMTQFLYKHAIVIGASIAGLNLARVLTNQCERVTIVERDVAPSETEFRKGAPQARHPHGLLKGGELVMEELFPGLREELLAKGAVTANFGSDLESFAFGQWRRRYESAQVGLVCSRPLLETTIYLRLSADPQITILHQTDVLGLCANADRTHVTGVELRNRQTQQITTLDADLVVDASGRDSNAPKSLTALGYTAPTETILTAKVGYATRIYQIPPGFKDTWKVMMIQPSLPDTRGGLLISLEGNRWQVGLMGLRGDYPPTTEESYLEFARSLPSSRLYEAIKDAQPLTDVYGYRRGENHLRHYEKLPRYLEGFLVGGDAVCSFNPVYGQGMTVAALGSVALDKCLQEQRRRYPNGDVTGLARRFQQRLRKVIEMPWQLATSADRRWQVDENQATPNFLTRLMQGYLTRLLRVAMTNPIVSEAFFAVQQMVAPRTKLFSPKVVWNVLTTPLAPMPTHTFQENVTPQEMMPSGQG
jgi:2-polyprenyl-6-methoxyphenol hydroxylase-like FAD-dependent oxidoreductase